MRNFLILSLFTALTFMFSCSKEPLEQSSTLAEQTAEIIKVPKEHLEIIKRMGFKTDDIHTTDDAYLVEGDIVILKKSLDEQKTRHYHYKDHLIDINWLRQHNYEVKIAISPFEGYYDSEEAMGKYKTALDEITKTGQEVFKIDNLAIKITKVSYTNYNFDILITMGDFYLADFYQRETLCAADIPDYGAPGMRIHVNSIDHPNPNAREWIWKEIYPDQVKTSLIHAICHCLGLAHHDGNSSTSYGEDESKKTEIKTIPEDWGIGTIMTVESHTYRNKNSSKSLSDGDKAALLTLYPKYILKVLGEESVFS